MNTNDIAPLAMEAMEALETKAEERELEIKDLTAVVVVGYVMRDPVEGKESAGVFFHGSPRPFWTTRGLLMEAADIASAVA